MRWKSNNPDTCIIHCASQRRLRDAITCAAVSRDNQGKKHPHQYRLKNSVLEAFGDSLLPRQRDIQAVQNFDELIDIVEQCRVSGIGELAIYDTAVRIGAFLNIWPTKIYLHAGARVGAAKLIGNVTSSTINKSQLPATFSNSNLSCYELEDLLCIYKRILQ
jgi:hypothetical protein